MGKYAPDIRKPITIIDCSHVTSEAPHSSAQTGKAKGFQLQVQSCYVREETNKDYVSDRMLITNNVAIETKRVVWYGVGFPIKGGPGKGEYIYHFDMSASDENDDLIVMASTGMLRSSTGWRGFIPKHVITGGNQVHGGHFVGDILIVEPQEHTVSSEGYSRLGFAVGYYNPTSSTIQLNNVSVFLNVSRFATMLPMYDPRG